MIMAWWGRTAAAVQIGQGRAAESSHVFGDQCL
jgi:hypothetical protein